MLAHTDQPNRIANPSGVAQPRPAGAPGSVIAFLLRGWRWTLAATVLGAATVTAATLLTQGPPWIAVLDWGLTCAYGALITVHLASHGQEAGMRAATRPRKPPCLPQRYRS
jgi:hypothetical protein